MEPQKYCLKWKNHMQHLQSTFADLIDHEVLCDVTLAAEGRVFKAHRFMLSACSPYFQNILNDVPLNKHPIIFLNNVSCLEIKALFSYMYKGQTVVSNNLLPSFLRTCENLKIQGLCDEAHNLPRNTDSQNNETPTGRKKKRKYWSSKDSFKLTHRKIRVIESTSKDVLVDQTQKTRKNSKLGNTSTDKLPCNLSVRNETEYTQLQRTDTSNHVTPAEDVSGTHLNKEIISNSNRDNLNPINLNFQQLSSYVRKEPDSAQLENNLNDQQSSYVNKETECRQLENSDTECVNQENKSQNEDNHGTPCTQIEHLERASSPKSFQCEENISLMPQELSPIQVTPESSSKHVQKEKVNLLVLNQKKNKQNIKSSLKRLKLENSKIPVHNSESVAVSSNTVDLNVCVNDDETQVNAQSGKSKNNNEMFKSDILVSPPRSPESLVFSMNDINTSCAHSSSISSSEIMIIKDFGDDIVEISDDESENANHMYSESNPDINGKLTTARNGDFNTEMADVNQLSEGMIVHVDENSPQHISENSLQTMSPTHESNVLSSDESEVIIKHKSNYRRRLQSVTAENSEKNVVSEIDKCVEVDATSTTTKKSKKIIENKKHASIEIAVTSTTSKNSNKQVKNKSHNFVEGTMVSSCLDDGPLPDSQKFKSEALYLAQNMKVIINRDTLCEKTKSQQKTNLTDVTEKQDDRISTTDSESEVILSKRQYKPGAQNVIMKSLGLVKKHNMNQNSGFKKINLNSKSRQLRSDLYCRVCKKSIKKGKFTEHLQEHSSQKQMNLRNKSS